MATRRSLLSYVLFAALFACVAVLWFAMRALLDVGGSCASGNTASVIRVECPDVAGLALPGSTIIGFAAFFGFAYTSASSLLALFVWPAMFLSLGWNFLEYGIAPPGDSGVVWSWLVCGVMFVAMGAGPLWFARPSKALPERVRARIPDGRLRAYRAELAKLDRLHRTGVLTDDQFALLRAANPAAIEPAGVAAVDTGTPRITSDPAILSHRAKLVHLLAAALGVAAAAWLWLSLVTG